MKRQQPKINRRGFLKSIAAAGGVATFGFGPDSKAKELYENLNSHRLSKPVHELKDRVFFDYVIVGSGYGGAILAARLAEAQSMKPKHKRETICLLERGREWLPGDFPSNLASIVGNMRSDQNRLGLYEFNFGDVDVFKGSGLGGTSLLNANVAIEAEKETFQQNPWPQEIASEYDNWLQEYYDRARKMLQVEKYPVNNGPELKKLTRLREDSNALGIPFHLLDLTVNFSRPDKTRNIAGVRQNLCRLCGDCVTGCNYGAKNTVNFNYLAWAKHKGAHIFTEAEVDHVEKIEMNRDFSQARYALVIESNGSSDQATPPKKIFAKNVILSGGSIGSTQILLRSQALKTLQVPQKVGSRFSTNGDYLAMSFNGRFTTNTVGFGNKNQAKDQPGTCMEAGADYRNSLRPLHERFILEHGAFPSGIVSILQRLLPLADFENLPQNLVQEIIGLGQSSLNRSMVYLGSGHDDAQGQIALNNRGQAQVRWPEVNKQPVFALIEKAVRDHALKNGGRFMVPNPRATLQKKPMTVHPLGGCPMASDINSGVVNSRGQVFDPQASQPLTVHEGLYIADGSIIPTALGVNPFLTISALSERIASFLTGERT